MLSEEDAKRAADFLRVKYGPRAEEMVADIQLFIRNENVELTRILAQIEIALGAKKSEN